MATIKPIEGRTVHQIQSGQVIVDLCSVVKELVENSIDAGASSIDVRFKNQGLDSIEVQDNGSGISPDNYETIALKHYTSKLSTYSDLATLQTFGFRGEALSSLCALSQFSIVTCMADDVPKGTKLDFESSGKLKDTHVVASQRGTNVIVEGLFHNLPVRRRELQRNIKREWNKVIALLNQYACIQTGVKFSVSQQPTKGKRIVLFSTKGNPTTRENLVNIFGAKTMTVLVKLDLPLEFEPTPGPGLKSVVKDKQASTEVRVQGYVSRPAHGEGRQTPDRQMFFVNGRPCGLPQFAKVFNEVYKAYNASQSPFIFADIQLDTHLYDVNVSPDKRTIMLHDQNRMLESLKEALASLFQSQDYSIPAAQQLTQKVQPNRTTAVSQNDDPETDNESPKQTASPAPDNGSGSGDDSDNENKVRPRSHNRPAQRARTSKSRTLTSAELQSQSLISRWVGRTADDSTVLHEEQGTRSESESSLANDEDARDLAPPHTTQVSGSEDEAPGGLHQYKASQPEARSVIAVETPRRVLDFNARLAETDDKNGTDTCPGNDLRPGDGEKHNEQAQIPAITPIRTPRDGSLASSLTPLPHKRPSRDVATVTIGDSTVTDSVETTPKRARIGSGLSYLPGLTSRTTAFRPLTMSTTTNAFFGSRLTQMFSAAQSINQEEGTRGRAELAPKTGPDADADSDDEGSNRGSQPSDSCLDEPTNNVVDEQGSPSVSNVADDLSSPPAEKPPGRNIESAQTTTKDNGANGSLGQLSVTDHRSHMLKGGIRRKDATLQHRQNLRVDVADLQSRVQAWKAEIKRATPEHSRFTGASVIDAEDPEEVLSLIISKSDFAKMTIVGQFNLGFIIAVRHAPRDEDGGISGDDELFIIDQHASDEKYNFERLQSTTVVQSQRLVHPKQLELTALEEEIIMENIPALDVNGFKVGIDSSGDQPVGSRCKLLALPLSRETTFTLSDLEELVSLLGDHHLTETSSSVPRPSKVRSMFAMRACRSSVMIGKALAQRQMEKLVRHMGELDKPWNCPHGRPTMRHLSGLGPWDGMGWKETEPRVSWAKYARN